MCYFSAMAVWDTALFETPNGWRSYVVREIADGRAYILDAHKIGIRDFPELGSTVEVEDWGPNMDGPFSEILLRRTSSGWIEADRTITVA